MKQAIHTTPTPQGKPSHFLRNLLIVFLSVLIALSSVLIGISLYRNARTYMRYGGTACDSGTYHYLASYYKLMHMRALAGIEGAEDTEAFWQSIDPETKKTQGELLEAGAKDYIGRILVCAALFDSAASSAQKKAAKETAKKAAEEILTFQADGDEEKFDTLVADYGYAYDNLEDIALLLYKATLAQSLYYGNSGETVSTRVTECDQYLKNNYSAVRILFIRTETTYVFTEDENGNKVSSFDDNGNTVVRSLLAEEIEQRERLMEDLDQRILAGTLEEAYFKSRMNNHYASYAEGHGGLYYFASNSAYTQSYREAGGADIVETAQSLSPNTCKKIAYADGYCYIYKSQVETGAFAEESYEDYFTDFYSNVAAHLFSSDVALFMDDVVVSDKAAAVSLTALPYKNLIRVRF